MSVECQVNIKSQPELDIGGRETCYTLGVILTSALSLFFVRLPLLENDPVLEETNNIY